MIKKILFSAPSSDSVHNISGVIFQPDTEPKGYFHIVHGMTEHIARYEKFMTDLAELGYICFGYDNLGHGMTVNSDSELGFIAKEKGYELLAKDVKVFSDAVFEKYDKKLPYYLLGHSMGSFIVRYACEKFVSPDKLIIMGTGGPNPMAGAGLALIKLIKAVKGERHCSPLVDSIAFGSYNKRFSKEGGADPLLWLTNDEKEREKYSKDKYCTFKFSVSAMGDLIKLIKLSNRSAWFKAIPKDMPVLLVSGKDDPVGSYGKGIEKVYSLLLRNNCPVNYILYEGARHEILNDFTYIQLKTDIVDFINS